ncbi:MAG: formylglycine-generating enzyme family protein [Fibromonadaceae bacterium]|jgi:formylglycine-generating enzyme required for sulfatase activity|nr:formylglycine-generating enzyme family protein [Fibromonadaceae bacterium]
MGKLAKFMAVCCILFLSCGYFDDDEDSVIIKNGKSSSSGQSSNKSSSSEGLNTLQIDWQDISEGYKSAVHGTMNIFLSPFKISKHLITQEQYELVMEENPSKGEKGNELPIEGITWFNAIEFCKKLSKLYGLEENAIRLPTEAEWEFAACSASENADYCPPEPAIHRDVLYWEWTNDCYDSDFPYGGVTEDPSGPPNCLSTSNKVRKGSAMSIERRFSTNPSFDDIAGAHISFRVVVRNRDYF